MSESAALEVQRLGRYSGLVTIPRYMPDEAEHWLEDVKCYVALVAAIRRKQTTGTRRPKLTAEKASQQMIDELTHVLTYLRTAGVEDPTQDAKLFPHKELADALTRLHSKYVECEPYLNESFKDVFWYYLLRLNLQPGGLRPRRGGQVFTSRRAFARIHDINGLLRAQELLGLQCPQDDVQARDSGKAGKGAPFDKAKESKEKTTTLRAYIEIAKDVIKRTPGGADMSADNLRKTAGVNRAMFRRALRELEKSGQYQGFSRAIPSRYRS